MLRVANWLRKSTNPDIQDLLLRNEKLKNDLQMIRETVEGVQHTSDDRDAKYARDMKIVRNECEREIAGLKKERSLAWRKYDSLLSQHDAWFEEYHKSTTQHKESEESKESAETKETIELLLAELEQSQQDCKEAQIAGQRAKDEAAQANTQLARYKNGASSITMKTKQTVGLLTAEREQLQRACQDAQNAEQKAKEEADQTRTQLTRFKESISTLTRSKPQISDEDICARVDQIFYAIQDFALKASRAGGFDISKLPKDVAQWLSAFMSTPERLPKAIMPYVIATIVAQSLLELATLAHYFGKSSNSMIDAVAHIAGAAAEKDLTETKAWLEPTRKLLGYVDVDALRESDESFIKNSMEEIFILLRPLLNDKWHTKAEANMRKIITSTFELFRLLHESKALFRTGFVGIAPSTKKYRFVPEEMQAIASGEEDGDLEGKALQMLVFPGVYKFGDEMGNNQNEMTVICKARVVPRKEATGSVQ
ncbi:hypothetical protein LTR27_006604 [Elasticomyces elasticus]|nr:hypothetical protein LTR27_006604 [Elasticomyces elasticus]